MNQTINDKLKKVFTATSFENYQFEDFDSASELIESLEEQISQDEVIYYSNAMEYLRNEDASLKDSLELAEELGYQVKDINSELLATLLQQYKLREELEDLRSDIEECFDE